MKNSTTSLHNLIENARNTQISIKNLEKQLSELNTPTLSDTSLLPSIYSTIQQQTRGEHIRDQRLRFVLVIAYLYSPASIYNSCLLKPGLRSKIGAVIGRSKGEVSALLTEAKFRYDHLAGFRAEIEKYLILW